MSQKLTPERAYIFRISHIGNVELILRDGMNCRNMVTSAHYIQIGNSDIIERRTSREVHIAPGGTLSDYVPFYFTPYSPMLYNIKTGYGVIKRKNDDIVIFVSSLHSLVEHQVKFVFTDRHAYIPYAEFYSDIGNLDRINWSALQTRDFTRSDRIRFEEYQAEALVYREMPFSALLGVATYNDVGKSVVENLALQYGVKLKVVATPNWYF